MRAVILAAGEGTRLRPHTLERPKCLVELAGRPLLDHQLAALRRAGAGAGDVTIVTGYRAEQIEARGLATVHNPRYDSTNMVASLMCADRLLDGSRDLLIAYGDIVYEPRVIGAIAACEAPLSTTVDRSWLRLWSLRLDDPLADAETLKLDAGGNILELGRKPSSVSEIEGQYMGLIKVRAEAARDVVRAYRELDPEGSYDGRDRNNMFMTSFLQHLIDHLRPVRAVPVDGGWLEVDTARDLELYEDLHRRGRLSDYCRLEAAGHRKPPA